MTANRPPKRILISRLRFIGDIVLTTPVLRAVRAAYPDAFIAYLGDRNAVTLLEQNPCVDEIIGYDFSRASILEQARVAFVLRGKHFDLAIDLFGNPRSALLTYLSGAAVRVGPDRKGRGRLYTVRVRDDGRPKTAIAFHNQYASAVGIQPVTQSTEIRFSDAERDEAAATLRSLSGGRLPDRAIPLIGLHPGATWPAKRWIAERFGQLADRLVSDLGARVIITSGPGDGEAVRTVRQIATTNPLILPVMPLRSLAAIIAACDVYVSNDAGPMHIAAATGTPTIGLFGPGEENIWFPYESSKGHTALRKDVYCHPCHLDFCNRPGDAFMECMKLLTVKEVLSAVSSALRARPRSSVH
jgi:heptosyltransferase III